jgi:hypothetical protein
MSSFNLQQCRRPSLKEMPSYREEASKALNRREELQRLKERLSSGNYDLLHFFPSIKKMAFNVDSQ